MSRGSHENSREAYRTLNTPALGARMLEVYLCVEKLGIATDREIMTALGKLDMNYARPRISELIKLGVLEEIGSCEDSVTGRTVRKIRINPDYRGESQTKPEASFMPAAIASSASTQAELF